jgi:hypothetical protein
MRTLILLFLLCLLRPSAQACSDWNWRCKALAQRHDTLLLQQLQQLEQEARQAWQPFRDLDWQLIALDSGAWYWAQGLDETAILDSLRQPSALYLSTEGHPLADLYLSAQGGQDYLAWQRSLVSAFVARLPQSALRPSYAAWLWPWLLGSVLGLALGWRLWAWWYAR